MKKNGFTIIEILVTIGIIGLIAGIAVPSFIAISNNIKKSNYENKVQYVLTKAESWASDTGRNATNIAHLIEEGYVEADNESGEYKNPIDNTSLLCRTIRITHSDNQYSASLTDEEFCEYQELEEQTTIIELLKYDMNNVLLKDEDWTRNDVKLVVDFKNKEDREKFQNSVVKIEWNGNNQNEIVPIEKNFLEYNSFVVKASQFLNNLYEVTVTIKIEDKTYIYKAYQNVKIDRQNPIVYKDDTKVDDFDAWKNTGKNVSIVSSDYDGSGIYGYHVSSVVENCSTNKSDYTKVSQNNFEVILSEGEHSICVMDNVDNVSEPSKIKIIKVDQTKPTLSSFEIENSKKGNKYYSELTLKISVQDDLSGAGKLTYCISDTTCNPTTIQLLDASGTARIPFKNPLKNAQKLCVKGFDQAGNESDVLCSSFYYFDNTAPDALNIVEKKNGHYKLNITGRDIESDIYRYQIYVSTDNNNFNLFQEKETNSFSEIDLGELKAKTRYYIKLVLTNYANLTSEKVISFDTQFNMSDAETVCNPTNGYCNGSIYLKYGGNVFAIYKVNTNSMFGVNVSNNMRTSIINDFCCDQGTCIEENVYNTSWSGIYSEGRDNSLKTYYDKLPSPTTYLNKEDYSFGVASSLPSGRYVARKTLKTYYGLLDLGEYYAIYQKPYMKNMGTLLSTVYTICLSGDHYECNNDVDNITGIYALNGTLNSQSAVTGANHDINVNAAMTLPFKKTIEFIGGSGTISDPYLVA